MIAIVLSHFHFLYGPRIIMVYPQELESEQFKRISNLMDLYESGFFVHISREYESANLIFTISNNQARGNVESLLISILFKPDTYLDLSLTKDMLEQFASGLSSLNFAYKAFYSKTEKIEGDAEIRERVKDFFFSYAKTAETAVNALKQSELRYKNLFESARDAIIIVEYHSGIILDVNTYTEVLFQRPKEEMKGLNISDVPFAEPFEQVRDKILTQASDHTIPAVELRIFDTSGRIVPIEANASKIDIAGTKYVFMICRDISKRKEAERRLEQSERDYKELVTNINSIILKWDFYGNILYMNEYGLNFFGFSKEELINKNILGTIVPKTESSGRDLELLMENITANPDKFKNNRNENMTKKGEKVWISWSNKALKDEQGKIIGILSVGNDITNLKVEKT